MLTPTGFKPQNKFLQVVYKWKQMNNFKLWRTEKLEVLLCKPKELRMDKQMELGIQN